MSSGVAKCGQEKLGKTGFEFSGQASAWGRGRVAAAWQAFDFTFASIMNYFVGSQGGLVVIMSAG